MALQVVLPAQSVPADTLPELHIHEQINKMVVGLSYYILGSFVSPQQMITTVVTEPLDPNEPPFISGGGVGWRKEKESL